MFDHVIKVAFVVNNVQEAVDFYTKTMDLDVDARYPSGEGEGEDFVFLKSKTVYIELLPEKAMGGAPVGFHHVAFKVDNVDTQLAELKERGATITAGTAMAPRPGIRLVPVPDRECGEHHGVSGLFDGVDHGDHHSQRSGIDGSLDITNI